MKIFLAGTSSRPELKEQIKDTYVLESYYYIKDWQKSFIQNSDKFLLDSGAFTFMSNFKGKINWKDYIDKYINFINEYNIKNFFELDIDSIVGYDNVKKIAEYIEQNTKKQCIPVWHKSRGIKEWKRITKEYDYVAIGGFVIKEIKKEEYKFIPSLLKIAKNNNCKVHGLGFTSMRYLNKLHFYSVDSTTWLSSSKFGDIQYFTNGEIKKFKTPKGKKPIYYKKRDKFVIEQYKKMQEYAEKYL